MAAYNGMMNTRLYAAAAALTDPARRMDRGAFWHSIHGTFSHLLWADTMWMSRFAGSNKPTRGLAESDQEYGDFAAMAEARAATDAAIIVWAATLEAAWLSRNQTWFSAAAQREMTASRHLLLMHVFNHQTHHRGQAHAMLTAAGQKTGDTDLMLIMSGI
jgi:uncharacterized damage-inducible protein DinB